MTTATSNCSISASPSMRSLWIHAGSQLGGTLRYLAPERCLGQPPTQAGDVFAFGVILYELTTGRYPYEVGKHSCASAGHNGKGSAAAGDVSARSAGSA